MRCGDGQASRELPPLKLFWGKNAPIADIALCPAAHIEVYAGLRLEDGQDVPEGAQPLRQP